MNDGLDIPIRFPLDKTGVVDADKLLAQMRQQIKAATDQTKEYTAWLEKNASELGAVSKAQAEAAEATKKAQAEAAAESARYQAALEKMHQTQVLETASKREGIRWTQSAKAGTADLSSTLATLKGNVVDATKASNEGVAADRSRTMSMKTLKDAVKGLSYEFPLLASAVNLIKNPIVATIASIGAAFVVWKDRVDQLQRSMGGIEIPEVTELQIERIDRLAEKFAKLNDKTKSLVESLDEFKQRIDADASFWRAMGVDLGTGPEQAKADLTTGAAANLEKQGRANMQAGLSISDDDLNKLAMLAAAGQKTLDEQKQRMPFLQQFADPNAQRSGGDNFLFARRYGWNATYETALAMENATTASAQANVDRYSDARRRQQQYLLGQSQVETANQLFGGNVSDRSSIANTLARNTNEEIQKLASVDPRLLANQIVKIGVIFTKAMEAAQKTETEISNRARTATQLQQ